MLKTSRVVPFQQPYNTVVYTATVLSESNQKYCEVEISGSLYKAQVAFSCLVKPIINDVVMCVLSEAGDYYITGIIERKEDQSMVMSFPGGVNMQSRVGSINIYSAESVTVAARDSFNCLSKRAVHKSDHAVVNYENITASGSAVQASYSTIRIFSDLINTITKQVLQKCKNYIRHSEEMDQVKAANMTRKINGLYMMNSENSVILSNKDMKIDAEHIHMG